MQKRVVAGLSMAMLSLAVVVCGAERQGMDEVAESYVKLVLALGEHDPDYVDAYYGSQEWRDEAKAESLTVEQIGHMADDLIVRLGELIPDGGNELLLQRHQYLYKQIVSVAARAAMLEGAKFSFDDESKVLYDAVARSYSEDYFREKLDSLDLVLPGRGSIQERYGRFRDDFVISLGRLDTVFTAAISECRERTVRHLELPPGESFSVEFVTGKSWSGYNWYQGGFKSLIQVNTDLPIHIDRAVDLACHEGYPGHHVYNTMLEQHLVRGRGWVEYSVYPLFSPQSLIAEGSANLGIDIAFPANERLEFEKRVLFPLAGLDPARAELYSHVRDLVSELDFAVNDAARRYLDGEISADSAAHWLETFSLMSPERARQRIRFIDQYRSYVINYNAGRDIVAAHIDAVAGERNVDRRWLEFGKLLSSPRVRSSLMTNLR
ncbi:MAG: hypothetical protein ACE5HT_06860 [Gemmatimonadales bacterium]